ncbi:MAG: hypothetical protein Q9187_006065 [Circinaria calcarea]
MSPLSHSDSLLYPFHQPNHHTLSILDALLLNFALSCAVWVLPCSRSNSTTQPLAPAHLSASLPQTLSVTPNGPAICISLPTLLSTPLPVLEPVFDRQILDRAAAGDILTAEPDLELVKNARGLPMERYDYWASADGAPDWTLKFVTVPSDICDAGVNVAPVGTAIPWHEWNMSASNAHYVLQFSKQEVDGMWKEASLESPSSSLHWYQPPRYDIIIRVVSKQSPSLPDKQ